MRSISSENIKVAVASPGNGVFITQTALAYYEASLLYNFYTSYVSNINTPFYSLLEKTSLNKELDRRVVKDIPSSHIKTYPTKEIIRTITSKFFNEKILDKVFNWSERSFDKWVSKKLNNQIDILHCYEHTSIQMMRKAKDLGIFIVYEQPSQHHSFLTPIIKQQLSNDEYLKGVTSELLINDLANERNKLRDEELALADIIVCNSTFTKKTLMSAGVNDKKIKVIPLGFPKVVTKENPSPSTKLRFIYAGTSNIRKGVHLLIKAWIELFGNDDSVELKMVGRFDLPDYYKNISTSNIVFIDSIPRDTLLENFLDSDVLILPTLADGFGMVITEAMSRGLCVIASNNSAGPDLIIDKVNGLIIDSGSIDSLKKSLIWCKNNSNQLKLFGIEAKSTASKYQWSDYRNKLVSAVVEEYVHKR